jgi:hypothetical protein
MATSREGAEMIQAGLAQVAHAIRRSAALYVAAAFVCTPESTKDDLKREADDLAGWIGGKAQVLDQQARQEEAERQASKQPLGQPWPPRD